MVVKWRGLIMVMGGFMGIALLIIYLGSRGSHQGILKMYHYLGMRRILSHTLSCMCYKTCE